VLTVTREITIDSKITTLMITHNMEQALTYGNRLVMMSQGHIVFDVRDENKRALTLAELRGKFREHTFKNTNTIAGI
jgi:putative ABC transport system ATP-binding protein